MLFEVAVLLRRKEKEGDEPTKEEKLVLDPTPVLAHNEQQAIIKAVRMIDVAADDEDRIEVLVRPF